MNKTELDKTDRQIITALTGNPSLVNGDVGKMLKVSEETVRRRLKALSDLGFVTRTIKVDPAVWGLPIQVVLMVEQPATADDVSELVIEIIEQVGLDRAVVPTLGFVWALTGVPSIIVSLRVDALETWGYMSGLLQANGLVFADSIVL